MKERVGCVRSRVELVLTDSCVQHTRPLQLQMAQLYDLKGSSVNRTVVNGPVLKDQNFIKNRGTEEPVYSCRYSGGEYGGLLVPPEQQQKFIEQVAIDTDFLRRNEIMDYSLLLGISTTKEKHQYSYREAVPPIQGYVVVVTQAVHPF